ncbi:tubulin domain-containing protein [Umbelopsis sp. AD052]|nr:tubulin domain-containing protein [Umbelopsis sp. AD052]
MHEVLTIQLGQVANFVGTHFWNAQNEYFEYGDQAAEPEFNHDILYRAGTNQRGIETYTPRALIYDLKGGFGSLKKYNKLFEQESEPNNDSWGEKVEEYKSSQYPKNRFQQHLDKMDEGIEEPIEKELDLDDSVKVWSDFNSTYYHPNTFNQINSYQMGNSIQPFDTYNTGCQAYDENEKETDSFDETFRFFAEECDQLQGFQIMTSVHDGFGGFTCGLLENIRDEYPKASILTYGISNMHQSSTQRNLQRRNLNMTMSAASLSEYSSLYVPVQLPDSADLNRPWTRYLSYQSHLLYQTSAIVAAAIESASVPWRLKKRAVLMSEVIGAINWHGNHNIASLGTCFPLDTLQGKQYTSADRSLPIEAGRFSTIKNFTVDNAKKEDEMFGESTVLRGTPDIGSRTNRDKFIEETFERLSGADAPYKLRTVARTGVPLPLSFPNIITSNYDGYILSDEESLAPRKFVSSLSQLSVGTHMYSYFEKQQHSMKGLNYRLFGEYEEGDRGKSLEDFEQLKDWLIEKADNFRADE